MRDDETSRKDSATSIPTLLAKDESWSLIRDCLHTPTHTLLKNIAIYCTYTWNQVKQQQGSAWGNHPKQHSASEHGWRKLLSKCIHQSVQSYTQPYCIHIYTRLKPLILLSTTFQVAFWEGVQKGIKRLWFFQNARRKPPGFAALVLAHVCWMKSWVYFQASQPMFQTGMENWNAVLMGRDVSLFLLWKPDFTNWKHERVNIGMRYQISNENAEAKL